MMAPRRSPWHALLLLLGLAGCDGADGFGFGSKPKPVPDRIDRYGPLEVVTHSSAYRAGDSGRWGQTAHWTLRFRGAPVRIDSRGGMFGDQPLQAEVANAVFVLAGGEQPELIVNVGDPNNTSAFHRVHLDAEGELQTPLLCIASGGDNGVRALAAAAGTDAGPFQGPQLRPLGAARAWLLGSRCLYDPATRVARTVPGVPIEFSLWSSVAPLGLSPDGRSLARFGSYRDADDNDQPAVLVADLVDGRWSRLPIDRSRMRYPTHEAIDAAWFEHHFAWQAHGGVDRLAERADFVPLPWRGYYLDGVAEYRLEMLQPGHAGALAALLQDCCGAQPLPGDADGRLRLALEGNTVEVHDGGFYIAATGKPYFSGEPGDPAVQRALVHRLGEAVDAALATGKYEAWFQPPAE